jgi:steroid delta-isomerase-like uncharacterized protein
MSEANKQAARRIFEEAFNQGDLAVVDEVIGSDAVDHDPSNPFAGERGPESAKKAINLYRGVFSDLHFTVEAQYADADVVITRWSSTGTHDGDGLGIPATGKTVEVSGIGIDRFEDGKVVEAWNHWDAAGMMQQLGAVPEARAAG